MEAADEVRLITLDPAHFHAALVQKEMLDGVSRRAAVYAPLGPDLLEHLRRVERFNSRSVNPTAWELDIHASAESTRRMCAERPGDVVVLAGRNRGKIGKIAAALDAGLHVLADKPWVIRSEDLPALDAALATAARKRLIAYDLMTERYEITSLVQRELVNDREIFGQALAGSGGDPAVYMESVHHIKKTVAGAPGLRPAFFFDIREQGEGLADVGTHLADLVSWTLFPGDSIRYADEIEILSASRWPTAMTLAQFQEATGLPEFPAEITPYIGGNRFDYYCNTRISYTIRGIHVRLDVLWNYESAAGTDLHHAAYRGAKARVEVRQGAAENYRPEVYVAANAPGGSAALGGALRERIRRMQDAWPGIACEESGEAWRVTIPEVYRAGHEAHFAQVLAQFLEYLKFPARMPVWERANMMAKYFVTTAGGLKTAPEAKDH